MLWFKAFHIVFVVTWFAGLFYLPRLFVYHACTQDVPGIDRFNVMERRLFTMMTIGAALAAVFGSAHGCDRASISAARAGCRRS